MIDDKKLKESELEQVCGGDDSGTEHIWKQVANANGTDLCRDPTLYAVKKHLNRGTKLKITGTVGRSSKALLKSGEFGYVLSRDLR